MMTQEEKLSLAYAIVDAKKRGDKAEAKNLQNRFPLSVAMAKCVFFDGGIEGLKEAKQYGLNFSEVEEMYGQEWYKHV